jgi:hypothetical protein
MLRGYTVVFEPLSEDFLNRFERLSKKGRHPTIQQVESYSTVRSNSVWQLLGAILLPLV